MTDTLTTSPGGHETKHAARRQFDRWALSYDRSWLNEIVFYPSIRACQEELHRWQQQRGAGPFRLLDVGCGTGSLLSILSADPLAERLVGLDYSPVMIRRAQEKFAQAPRPDRLAAVVGDSERLPFCDGAFDLITCCNSFHHYPHQAEVVRAFHRVLRPGGRLILIDGFRDNVIGWIVFDLGVASVEKNVHHAAWSTIRTYVESAGFSRLRQRKLNVLAPLLVNVADK